MKIVCELISPDNELKCERAFKNNSVRNFYISLNKGKNMEMYYCEDDKYKIAYPFVKSILILGIYLPENSNDNTIFIECALNRLSTTCSKYHVYFEYKNCEFIDKIKYCKSIENDREALKLCEKLIREHISDTYTNNTDKSETVIINKKSLENIKSESISLFEDIDKLIQFKLDYSQFSDDTLDELLEKYKSEREDCIIKLTTIQETINEINKVKANRIIKSFKK